MLRKNASSTLSYFDHHIRLGEKNEADWSQVIIKDHREKTLGFHSFSTGYIWIDGEWYVDKKLSLSSQPEHIEGYYSMIRFHSTQKRMELVTDKWGMKPLYLYEDSDYIIWSSEIKGIVGSLDISLELDQEAINFFHKNGRYEGEKTAFKKIRLVSPATILSIDLMDKSISEKTYWDISNHLVLKDIPFKKAVERTTDLLRQSFEKRFDKKENSTLALSGGMDSRCLLGLLPSSSTYLFTFGEKESDDVRLAERVCNGINEPHHLLTIDQNNWLKDRYQSIWRTEGQQSFFEVHSAPIINLLPQKGDVVFNGFGGATLLGGIFSGKDHRFPKATYTDEFLDVHILREHMRRGVQQGSLDVGRALVQRKPYLDTEFILHLLSLPNSYRKNYRLFRGVLNNILDPQLLSIPWENTMLPFSWKNATTLALQLKWPTARRISGWMRPAFHYPSWIKHPDFMEVENKYLLQNEGLKDQFKVTEGQIKQMDWMKKGRWIATAIWLDQIQNDLR